MTHRLRPLLAALCAVSLGACASTAAGGSPAPQGIAPLPAVAASASSGTNVAGRYKGKFLIKKSVVAEAHFNITQSGSAVGGILKLVLSDRTLHEPVALTLDAANNTLSGVATDAESNTECTYALKATYDPKTFVLSGTSSPLNCSGKVATFTTKERCFYNTAPASNAIRAHAHGILEC